MIRSLARKLYSNIRESIRKSLQRITDEFSYRLRNYVGSKLNIPQYSVHELPTIYEATVLVTKNRIQILIRPIGKILGTYIPELRKIVIDPILEKCKHLKEYVLKHEYAHYIQDLLGILTKYPREFIEGMADYLVEKYGNLKRSIGSLSPYIKELTAFKGVLKKYGNDLRSVLTANPRSVITDFYEKLYSTSNLQRKGF